MNVFQRVYNAIKAWATPPWLQEVLQYVFDNVVLPTFQTLAKEGYNMLTSLIIQAAKNEDWTPKKKFDFVYSEFCKSDYIRNMNVGESFINRSIELVYAELKAKEIV